MTPEEKEQHWFDVFQRGFANTNITLTKVDFLDLIPDELKPHVYHPRKTQGETQ